MRGPLVVAWGALVFMACAAVVAGAFEAGAKLWDQTPAAWVQAVGSIAAIIGASWIAGDQTRREDARRTADRAERLKQARMESAEQLDMLGRIARDVAHTVRTLVDELRSGRVEFPAVTTLFGAYFSARLQDLDRLVVPPSGTPNMNIMVFGVRGIVSHVEFAISATHAAETLGIKSPMHNRRQVLLLLQHVLPGLEEHARGAWEMRDQLLSDHPPF